MHSPEISASVYISSPSRIFSRTILLLMGLQVLFTLALIWEASLPTKYISERVSNALSIGELTLEDYPINDTRRGYHQANDCLILTLLLGKGETLPKALAPRHWITTPRCWTLQKIIANPEELSSYPSEPYTRYWHGYLPVAAGLLMAMDLSRIRSILKYSVYGALVLVVFAASRSPWRPNLFIIGTSISLTGITFWGLPYFGQSLSHAPGDFFVIIGIATLFFWRDPLSRTDSFVPFCAAYGAGVVYLEFLTGLLPTAAGLLIPISYMIKRGDIAEKYSTRSAWKFAAIGLIAFAFGAVLTVVFKQFLAMLFASPDSVQSISSQLFHYTQPVSAELFQSMESPEWIQSGTLTGLLAPFGRLLWKVNQIAYGYKPLGILVCIIALLAWLIAAILAVRSHATILLSDFFIFVAGSFIPVLWIVLLPTHTYIHANFMVRILLVPLSLGFAACALQLAAWHNKPGDH